MSALKYFSLVLGKRMRERTATEKRRLPHQASKQKQCPVG